MQSKTTATENELDLALKRLQESNEAAAVVDEVRADLSRTQADHQRKLATLEEAKLRKEADYDQKTNELQQALERSQLTEVSLTAEASRTKNQYEASLRNMEIEYSHQVAKLEQQHKIIINDYQQKCDRMQWQYDVTMKCLANMTNKRKLLTDAFVKAGVNQEARELLLRDSGSDEDDYDVIYGSGGGGGNPPTHLLPRAMFTGIALITRH